MIRAVTEAYFLLTLDTINILSLVYLNFYTKKMYEVRKRMLTDFAYCFFFFVLNFNKLSTRTRAVQHNACPTSLA